MRTRMQYIVSSALSNILRAVPDAAQSVMPDTSVMPDLIGHLTQHVVIPGSTGNLPIGHLTPSGRHSRTCSGNLIPCNQIQNNTCL